MCLGSIQALLSAPNPEDPLAENIAKHWKDNEQEALATGGASVPAILLLNIVPSSTAEEGRQCIVCDVALNFCNSTFNVLKEQHGYLLYCSSRLDREIRQVALLWRQPGQTLYIPHASPSQQLLPGLDVPAVCWHRLTLLPCICRGPPVCIVSGTSFVTEPGVQSKSRNPCM